MFVLYLMFLTNEIFIMMIIAISLKTETLQLTFIKHGLKHALSYSVNTLLIYKRLSINF